MKQFLKLHHVSVLVNDVDAALAFYRDILGMEVDDTRPDLGYPGAWLKAGDAQLHLLELPNPDPVSNRPQHAGRDRHLALMTLLPRWTRRVLPAPGVNPVAGRFFSGIWMVTAWSLLKPDLL